MTAHETPWRDDDIEHGTIYTVTDNPISQAISHIAQAVGREVVKVPIPALPWLREHPLTERDALVICDHDEPGTADVLDFALRETPAYFVGMVASRKRAEGVREAYADQPAEVQERLKSPCGMNLGGRSPGEIALSIVAQIVADEYGRDGRAMKQS